MKVYQLDESVIPLRLPDTAKPIGAGISWSPDLPNDQDIVQVSLPNGYGIDVGNYSDDPKELHIVAFQSSFHNQIQAWDTTDPQQAAEIVERFCWEHEPLMGVK